MLNIKQSIFGLLLDAVGELSVATTRVVRFRIFSYYAEQLQVVENELDKQVDASHDWAYWHDMHGEIHTVWNFLFDAYKGIVVVK